MKNSVFSDTSVVIDLGSGFVKAGLSVQDKPNCIFPSVIAHPKFQKIMPYIGEMELIGPNKVKRGLYQMDFPIKRGVFTNENQAKFVLYKIINELEIQNNREMPLFMTVPYENPIENKKLLGELIFESLQYHNIFFGTQGLLSLYSLGKRDGVVFESGEGVTQVVSTFDGRILEYASRSINFAGRDIVNYLQMVLKKSGIYIQSSSLHFIL